MRPWINIVELLGLDRTRLGSIPSLLTDSVSDSGEHRVKQSLVSSPGDSVMSFLINGGQRRSLLSRRHLISILRVSLFPGLALSSLGIKQRHLLCKTEGRMVLMEQLVLSVMTRVC
jgi:hypothetical protein